MANLFYNQGKLGILNGDIDLLTDDITVMMVDSDYTVNPDHSYVDMGASGDPVRTELSGSGYSRKGLGGKEITEDPIYDTVSFIADSITYPNIDIDDVYGLIIFKSTGDDTTSPLLFFIDEGFPISPTEVSLTISWTGGKVFQL